MKNTITCFCENQIDVDFADEVELNPQVISAVLEGSFQNVTCPSCETVLKPEFATLFKAEDKKDSIYFLPESERNAYLSGSRKTPEADRVVIGFRELLEKIKIREEALDDQIIEMIKYFYLEKAPSDADLQIYFSRKEKDTLYFHIHGLKKDEVGETGIGNSFYDKLKTDIIKMAATQPFDSFLQPPYVSIKKIYLEE
jgi:hypothetical protein